MNFNCVLVHMLHVFVRLANRITMGKIFSYSNLNQQEGCLVAGVEMQHKGFHPGAWLTSAWQHNQKKSTHRICFSYMGHFREHITDGVMTWGKACTLLSVSLWWCHWNSFQLNEAAVSRENFKKVSWKAKKPEAEEFPLQQGQSSEFKHWKGWLRGDLHDESLQRNLNRNIQSGLWTCRELDWYVQNPTESC